MTRRQFCASAAIAAAPRQALVRRPVEWTFTSTKTYRDPFSDLDLNITFEGPDKTPMALPAFWTGANTWRARFAPPSAGTWTWRTMCSDTANPALHNQSGEFIAAPKTSSNPLLRHGPLRVASDHRHFEHEDGTPFFWLGDTWWMGLCRRLTWPDGFQKLAADRVRKGFNVVQIVAGLYPDMPSFDPRGANEAGFPWEPDFARINPAYFDRADTRIQFLIDQGLVPCIVGCWGYFLPLMGEQKMKQHWRYLVARWGSLPVVWCLAGEGTMPYYLSKAKDQDAAAQKHGWTEIARYVRSIDPYRRPITIHPSSSGRSSVDDASVLDFDMLQTGHSDRRSIPNTVARVRESYAAQPPMPVLVGEVCYEGIMEASREEVQRIMFWASVLNGAAGHTYGANGIWQVNTATAPFGASPHGRSWGDTPWEAAYQLPGSRQLGLAKQFLSRYQWWRFEPHPEWADPNWSPQNMFKSFAAGIPGEVRIFYIPDGNSPVVRGLEPNVSYRAFFWNPVNAKEYPVGPVTADSAGNWSAPNGPIFQDWVLTLEKS